MSASRPSKKDRRYARRCVALIEDLNAGRITREEYNRNLAALNCWNNTGPEKPGKQVPRPILPGLDGVSDA